jgi:hypothetical protein
VRHEGGRRLTPAPTERQALWLKRMRKDLPAAARNHPEWPIRLDHCFGRVVLDAVCGGPWRNSVAAPAWRNLTPDQLDAAIDLADSILTGRADLGALNAASLRARHEDAARKTPRLALSAPV